MKRALLMLVVTSLVFLMSTPTYGRDLSVPGDYSSIQRAINAASYGDTVIVSEGTYYEQITMKKGVDVVAEGTAESTIIDASDGDHHCGGGMGGKGINTVRGADEATIDGFTITGAFTEDPEEIGPRSGGNGVLCVERKTLRGTSPTIQNCIIKGNSRGIACAYGACPIIRHNWMLENPFVGIGTRTVEGYPVTEPTIEDNEIYSNGKEYGNAGIGCDGSSPTITNNFISDNGEAGIGCKNGAAPVITDNEICNNAAAGVGTDPDEPASRIEVHRNFIHDNTLVGIGCNSVTGLITNNIVVGNGTAGIAVHVTPLNEINDEDGIYNNVVAYSGTVGIVNDTGTSFPIKNNICYYNTTPGIKSDVGGYSYNCLYGNNPQPGGQGGACTLCYPWCWRPQYGDNDPGPGDLLYVESCWPPWSHFHPVDPLFVYADPADPENYDFHLKAKKDDYLVDSPCIDTGDPLILDADGSRSDMGAYGGPDPFTLF